MRISDWSSDVCSSDLTSVPALSSPSCRYAFANRGSCSRRLPLRLSCSAGTQGGGLIRSSSGNQPDTVPPMKRPAGRQPRKERKSVVWGTSVSVRVDLGGRRLIQKKKYIQRNEQT